MAESRAELEALEPEWWELWHRCPAATPFQSPAWLLPWWKHLGRGRLWTLAVREGARLVGLAPLFLHRLYGLPVRRVAPLGAGASDYLDFILDPECEEDAPATVTQHLGEHRAWWDCCDLPQLPPHSPLLRMAVPPMLRAQGWVQEVCPVLPLPDTAAEFHTGLSHGLRKHLEYCRRRLEREAKCAFTLASEGDLTEHLEALFSLHRSRWTRRGLPGCFSAGAVREFHREAARRLLERGWLRLHLLRVDRTPAAALYGFQCRGRMAYYAGGFHPDLARYSPGTLMVAHAAEAAIREGAREFDFLRGNEPYKYRWGAEDRPNHRWVLAQPTWRGSAGLRLCRLEDRAKEALVRASRRAYSSSGGKRKRVQLSQ